MAKKGQEADSKRVIVLRSRILGLMGDLMMRRGDFERALGYLQDRITLCELAHDWNELANTYLLKGHAFRMLNNLRRASDEFRKALAVSRVHGLRSKVADSLNHIATLFYFQREFEKALEYNHASLAELKDNGRTPLLGRTLMQVGNIHRKLEENKKAERFFSEALKVFRELGDEYNIGMTLANRALLLFAQDDEGAGRTQIRESFERLFFAGAQSEIQLFRATIETVYSVCIEE